jgi:tRNA threonylcarbamoyladenosine biosynthesis protein TsaE
MRLARLLRAGDVVFLKGELGGGKTTLVQGIARGMGVRRFVRSSSFILVNEYAVRPLKLYHMDLYRLAHCEVENLGLEEYLFGDGITVVEWAERMEPLQLQPACEVRLSWISETRRKIEVLWCADRKRNLKNQKKRQD